MLLFWKKKNSKNYLHNAATRLAELALTKKTNSAVLYVTFDLYCL